MADPGETREDRVAAVLASWMEARERGESPSVESLVPDDPGLAAEVRRRVALLAAFDRIAEPGPDESGVPRILGDFRLGRRLGKGAMGVVYEAEQLSLARPVAVKVLHPSLTASPTAAERFRREARAAARLRHPAVVPVIEAGEQDGFSWFAMERVRGRSLQEVLEAARTGAPDGDGPGLPESPAAVALLFAGVAEGLESAHAAGILHRDVKPSNLLLDESGALRLADFGLARLAGEGASMTTPGVLVGTPYYMSPEQAAGGRSSLDARADVYSLGATLYETFTFRPPFEAETLPELCRRISTEDPVRPRAIRADLPRDLETIVLKALEKDPGRRYSSAAEMALDLRLFAAGAPVRARALGPLGRLFARARRHPRVAALAAGTLVLAAAAAVFAAVAEARSARLRLTEYLALCVKVEEGSPAGQIEGPEIRYGPESQNSIGLLVKAAALRPDRPEAPLGLALQPGSVKDVRFRHAERARALGLGPRGFHLLRAYILHREGEPDAARAEEDRAAAAPPAADALEAYLEGRVRSRWGRRNEAIGLFTTAVEGTKPGETLWLLSVFSRALAREAEGDFSGMVRDMSALSPWSAIAGSGGRVWLAELARRMGPIAREGRVLGALPLAEEGAAAAIAPRSGRLFVLDGYQGGSVRVVERGRLDPPRRIATAGFESGVAYEPVSRRMVVAQAFARALTLLDAEGDRPPIRVEVPVHPPPWPDAVPTISRVVVDGARRRVFVQQGFEIVRYGAREEGPPVLEGRFPHGIPGDQALELAVDPATGRVIAGAGRLAALRLLDPDGAAPPIEIALPNEGGPLAVDPGTRRCFVRAATRDRVFVVDLASKALLPPLILPSKWSSALGVDPSRGLLLVAGENDDGPLSLLDTATLEKRLVLPISGGSPSAVAVDAEAGRAYVVLEGGWVVCVDIRSPEAR